MSKLSVSQILGRAKAQLKNGDHLGAEHLFAEVVMLFPNNVKAQQGLRVLRTDPEKFMTVNPPQKLMNRLIGFVQDEKLELAIMQTQNLLAHYPKAVALWNILGIASAQLGKHDRAIEAFEQIITLIPHQASAYFNLGNVFKDMGQFARAVEAYTTALEIKPDYNEAFNNLSILLSSHDLAADQRQIDVMKHNQKLELIKAENAQKLVEGGVEFLKQERYAEAIQLFEKSIQEWPDYATAHYNLAVALQNQGRLTDAIDAYRKALSLQPDYPEAYNNMGLILKRQGKIEDAVAAYKEALHIRPNSALSYNNLAVALEVQGNLADAIAAYKKALSIQPDYYDAVINAKMLSIQLKNTHLIGQELPAKLMDSNDALHNGPKIHILKAIEAFLNANKSLVQNHLGQYESLDPSLFSLLSNQDRRFCEAYHKYLSKLIETHGNYFTNSRQSDIMYHFGESHCLSYAYQEINAADTKYVVMPKITFGGKAFHFMREKPDAFKEITKANLHSIPKRSKAFISFGEIDCRLNEGFLVAVRKINKPLHELVSNTVKGYVSWFAKQNEEMNHDLYFFNVPARVYNKDITFEQNMAIADVIAEFNAAMARYVKIHNFRLIDVHKFTVGADGYSNCKYHLDGTHLGPTAVGQFMSQIN